ncbi:hypothetical protein ACFW6S_15605 [Streptomyces sp. NPDC058740]|uniref:hypothetical protein n=1 Tax=Streptomyces sp. NPDC058740 TaxID=3346619 RepID=UPI003675EEDA
MSEDEGKNVTADAAVAAVAAEPGAGRGGARRKRRLFPYVLTGVLVLGVAGAGTYTGITVSAAERHAPTIAWEKPREAGKDPVGDLRRGRASTPLSKLLLPVPGDYSLGPDIDRYGNDGELGATDAVALLKQQGKGLSGKKRREYDRRVEKLGVQGIAVRSYASIDSDLVIEVQVIRMKDKRFVTELHELRSEFAGLLHLGKGPKVEGHANASCFVLPRDEEEDEDEREYGLEGLTCSAYDSEYFVSVVGYGGPSLDKSAVAELLQQQLDHIESPGEYV